MHEPREQLALLGRAGLHHEQHVVMHVQAQVALAGCRVGAVAVEAVLRQDRQHVAPEVHRPVTADGDQCEEREDHAPRIVRRRGIRWLTLR